MDSDLWLLMPMTVEYGEWSQPFGKVHAQVVRARSESAARLFAASAAGDEGQEVWNDPDKTSCVALVRKQDGVWQFYKGE